MLTPDEAETAKLDEDAETRAERSAELTGTDGKLDEESKEIGNEEILNADVVKNEL